MEPYRHHRPPGRLCAIFLSCILPLSALAELLTCPECTNAVSSLATFCPRCGCPADVIRRETATKPDSTRAEPAKSFFVRVKTDAETGFGIGVVQDDETYIVLDQSILYGATALSVSQLATNLSVFYGNLEIAEGRDLARFSTTDTNIAFLAVGISAPRPGDRARLSYPVETEAGAGVTSLWTQVVSAGRYRMRVATDNARAPVLYGVLDSRTNLVALAPIRSAGTHQDAVVLSGTKWKRARPLEFRTQSRMLRQGFLAAAAATVSENRAALVTGLRETEWLTPHMARLAKRLSIELEE
jgi:hypothetical protein